MTHYRKYIFVFAIYCALLFTAPHIYAHFHFEVREPVDFYLDDKRSWERSHGIQEPFMSYDDWMDNQERRESNFWRDLGEGCATSFDPWYQSAAEANDEHGRD